MARITLGKLVPRWREKALESLKDLTTAARKETRDEIARAMSEESERQVFRRFKLRSKVRREKAHLKLLEKKRKIVKRLHPEWSEDEIDGLASKATLLKGEELRKSDFRGKRFIRIRGGAWKKARRVVVRGEVRYIGIGRFLSNARVNRSLAMSVYWNRVRALADALELPLSKARKADKYLLEVPENVRRRIYEQLVRKALRTKEHKLLKKRGRYGRKTH